jgi:hypothetical protein
MEHEMSNAVKTADIIAKEAVRILEGNLVMGKLVYRGYEDEFDKKVNGYEVGDTISIRRPTDFTVRDGATAAIQDVIEGKTSITVDKQKGIDFKFTSKELTLNIGDLSERVITPAMIQLANQVDLDLFALYKKVNNHVTIPAGGINSFANFALAPTRMDTCAMPQEDRYAVLSPADTWAMLGSQTALYMQDVAKGAYRNASLGMIGGIDTYMSQSIPSFTTGSRTGTDTISTSFLGDTWSSTKDTNTSTIGINNMSGATVTLKEGDVITIANVYDVHPVTKAQLPHLKHFVVTTDYTASGSAIASVVVRPAIIFSGAQQTCFLSSGTDINGAVVTYKGTASTAFTQNLFFHKNAFSLVMVPMVSPPGAVDVARRSYKGITVRVIPYYDGTNDVSNYRLDVLYGVKTIDPRLAVRASLMADVP